MKLLKIYKNGELYGQKLSVEHLQNSLALKYIDIEFLQPQGDEVARIMADEDLFQVFEKHQF